MKKLLSIIELI